MSDDLKRDVIAKFIQFIAIEKLETNKFEFKRQWYNLKDVKEKSEFFRDSTAVINSYGGDDGFIVIGIDDKTKELFDTKIEDSGFKDQSSIRDIVDTNIDKPFRFDVDYVEVNGKRLSVVHLFPSTDKPHVILKYQDKNGKEFSNEIFLRSGSGKVVASKGDLDRMYIERNTILVDRMAEVSINLNKFTVAGSTYQGESVHSIERLVTIENRGIRILPIYRIMLRFVTPEKVFLFIHATHIGKPIVVEPNGAHVETLYFENVGQDLSPAEVQKLIALINEILENPQHGGVTCNLILATGEHLPAILFMPNIHQTDDHSDIMSF